MNMTDASPLSQSSNAWDRQLGEIGGHMLQSRRWGEFKQRHGWNAHRILVTGPEGIAMAQVLYRRWGPISVGYIPRGPTLAGDPAVLWPVLREHIDTVARRNRAIMTLIEPDSHLAVAGTLQEAGVTRRAGHLQPGRTVRISLADDETILSQMHQKIRYNVRLAHRRGVVIEGHSPRQMAIEALYRLMEDTANRNAFGIHSLSYYGDFLDMFGDDAVLLFAKVDDGALAAGLVAARFGKEAIYMYGGSSTRYRAHGAAFLLQVEAMRWAREHGCETYDLWGIPKHDPESLRGDHRTSIAGTRGDDWRGLHRFKTGFGGEIVSYPDMLERRHVPVLPWLARNLNVIKG